METVKESISNSDFKFEIKESLGLPYNTICYIDEIPIPPTRYTIETYKNQLYIETTSSNLITSASAITLPNGNYTAPSLATTITSLLQTRFPEIGCSCDYNNNVGTIKTKNVVIQTSGS